MRNFAKAQNEVKTSLLNVGFVFRRAGYELHEIIGDFMDSDFSIKPSSIRYAVNQKEQLEKVRKLNTKRSANDY